MDILQVRDLAIKGTKDGDYYLRVVPKGQTAYAIVVGSSNPDVNPRIRMGKMRIQPPVSERTPALLDLRVLRYLRSKGPYSIIEGVHLSTFPADELVNYQEVYHYRSTSEFLQDLERCNNDMGKMLSVRDNLRLTLK